MENSNSNAILPATDTLAASVILSIALRRHVKQTDLTDSASDWQAALDQLRALNWILETDTDGAVHAADIDPPRGWLSYEGFLRGSVVSKAHFWMEVLRDETLPRLANYVQVGSRFIGAALAPQDFDVAPFLGDLAPAEQQVAV